MAQIVFITPVMSWVFPRTKTIVFLENIPTSDTRLKNNIVDFVLVSGRLVTSFGRLVA